MAQAPDSTRVGCVRAGQPSLLHLHDVFVDVHVERDGGSVPVLPSIRAVVQQHYHTGTRGGAESLETNLRKH